MERLARTRDVIAVDLPGFGACPPLSRDQRPTPAVLAEALIELRTDLGVERPHVAGNSLGGWVALEVTKAGGARSVCAISPAGLWPAPLGPRRRDGYDVGRRLRPLVGTLLASPRGRRLLLRGSVARPELVPAADARRLVDGYLRSAGYAEANREMRAAVFDHEGRIGVPVTIAWGKLDRLLGRPSPRRFPPGTRYLEMPGWGHIPTWDDPGGVARMLECSSETARTAPEVLSAET